MTQRVEVVDDCKFFPHCPVELLEAEPAAMVANAPMVFGVQPERGAPRTAGHRGGPSLPLQELSFALDRSDILPKHLCQKIGRIVAQKSVSPNLKRQCDFSVKSVGDSIHEA
jgi:hypothetical protein